MSYEVIDGCCLEVMCEEIADNSIDAIVTDPPYGLNFMGKKWDYDVPGVDIWRECLRVLKPGGYLLAFAGTRTQHRMACAIEDAGFEIRDMIAWVYGSGMPKHTSCLKPALEPITMARKAHDKSTPLNIDKCRIAIDPTIDDPRLGGKGVWDTRNMAKNVYEGGFAGTVVSSSPLGRYPANLIHDGSDEVIAAFPAAAGQLAATGKRKQGAVYGAVNGGEAGIEPRNDTGSAARFFYCAKSSRKERGEGNTHNTVKPLALMRYLCRLVTPPGGTVLDPFLGSGSTGVAAVQEGFNFIGIEKEENYADIAYNRIKCA